VERVCKAHHHRPMETMLEAVVQAFVSAKLDQADTSVALYSVASELQGEALVAKLKKAGARCDIIHAKDSPRIGLSEP